MKNLITIIVSMLCISTAYAESGQVEFMSSGIVSIATNDFGDSKYSITNTRYITRVISTNVSFFKIDSLSTLQCLGIATSDSAGTNASGTCLSTYADSEKLRFNYVRGESTPQLVNGTAEIIGMPGKFVNVKGSCKFEQTRLILDGVIHLSTHNKCTVSN